MAQYSQLNLPEAEAIARKYSLACRGLEAVEAGSDNSNFILECDEGRFVLTLFEVKDRATITSIANLYKHLETHHFPAPRLVSRLDEEAFGLFESKPYLLKGYIEGMSIEQPTMKQLKSVGGQLAQLHALPAPKELKDAPPFGLAWMRTLLDEKIEASFGDWLIEKLETFDKEEWGHLPKGLVHGDVFLDNLLFDDEAVAVILDFEEASHYALAFDIGMAIVGCCRKKGILERESARALLQGYQTERSLTEAEIAALPILACYAASITATWRYWKFNVQQAKQGKDSIYLEMVAIADEAHTLDSLSSMRN